SRLIAFDAVPIAVGRRNRRSYPVVADLVPEDRYYQAEALAGAVEGSQCLVVCCPLTDQTRGMVNEQILAALPVGGYVINVARAAVIDYEALVDALRTGHLAGAGLDVVWREPVVPQDPLLGYNVVVTPHVGGVTME